MNQISLNAILFKKATYKLNASERAYLQKRLYSNNEKNKERLIFDISKKLGFDINKEFGNPIKQNEIVGMYETSINQKHFLVLKQNIFNGIMACEKRKFFSNTIFETKNNKHYKHEIEYFFGNYKGKKVILSVSTITKFVKIKNETKEFNSISVHILFKGKIPLLAYRLDINPKCPHINRFKHGKIAKSKINIMGPHEHFYSEKFAVVFPSFELVGHYDVESAPKLKNLQEYHNYVIKRFNFQIPKKHICKTNNKSLINNLLN